MSTETTERLHALFEARLAAAQAAKTPEDWQRLRPTPEHAYPFSWGPCWKQCIEYRVDDFAAEVAFFTDVLAFPTNAFSADYAMLTSPDQGFYFSVVPAGPDAPSTPKDSIRLEFMIQRLAETVQDLTARGIEFEQPPTPWAENSPLHHTAFRTPHGIQVRLWGMVPGA